MADGGTKRIVRLTEREMRFVEEYLLDLEPRKAARRAGVPTRKVAEVSRRYMDKPEIRLAIERKMDERFRRNDISEDWIIAVLKETVDRCRQAEQVRDRYGNPILVRTPHGTLRATFEFNARGVYQGLELLGRHRGMFADEKKSSMDVTVRVKRFSDDAGVDPADGAKDVTPPKNPPIIDQRPADAGAAEQQQHEGAE